MRRRLPIIIASIVVLVGILIGAYVLFFVNSAELIVSDNPFGEAISNLVTDDLTEMEAGAGEEVAPRFVRVSNRPVAEGVVAINRIATTTVTGETASGTPMVSETSVSDTEIRFIDRASGNIYKYMAHERSLTRLSNKTLPGIQEASWLTDGSVAYARFLGEGDQVATYVLNDSGEGGFFLEQGLAQATAMDATSLFTLLSGPTGSVGSISRSDGTNGRALFTTLLSSLAVHPTRGNFYAYTKPSAFLDGYAFQVSRTNGSFTRILGPLRGLSVLPNPDGTKLLYTYLDRGSLRLAMIDTATRGATILPVSTLTEKCTWAPDGESAYCGVPTSIPANIPDDWYQGAAPFSDRLWKIDVTARIATLVVDPSTIADVTVDAVALTVDPQEDVLVFTDRYSGSLWVYDL